MAMQRERGNPFGAARNPSKAQRGDPISWLIKWEGVAVGAKKNPLGLAWEEEWGGGLLNPGYGKGGRNVPPL